MSDLVYVAIAAVTGCNKCGLILNKHPLGGYFLSAIIANRVRFYCSHGFPHCVTLQRGWSSLSNSWTLATLVINAALKILKLRPCPGLTSVTRAMCFLWLIQNKNTQDIWIIENRKWITCMYFYCCKCIFRISQSCRRMLESTTSNRKWCVWLRKFTIISKWCEQEEHKMWI